MPMNWSDLRPWEGSQQKGFEELCAQLAALEEPTPSSKFTRKGVPDAGVECYWTLPSGDVWAWQAKFFTGTLAKPQWRQLDHSVEAAIRNHPTLVQLIICLPLDLADPHLPNKTFSKQAWDLRVQ